MQQHEFKNGGRNQVGMCHFLAYTDQQSLDIMNAVTGWGIAQAEWEQIGRRGLAMARLFNMLQGKRRSDDRLPARFTEDLPMHKGVTPDTQREILTQYYVRQGWDAETGLPTKDTVTALGMQEYEPVRSAIPV
jgi:aldehyde:ferredoxin oxidoreductase